MRLEGKTAIITGAGRGIGYAYAERFLHEGANVVVAEVNRSLGEESAASLAKIGPASFTPVDVADPESAEASAAFAADTFGRVDILINNAALYGDWDTTDQSLEYLRRMFDVNLHGSWIMARAVAPHMVRGGGGRIINQASGAAYNYGGRGPSSDYRGMPSFNYAQTKWGVVGLTKYLAGYLGRWNITANCIAPGVVFTEATLGKVPEAMRSHLTAEQAVPGEIQAEDVCGAAVFFASDDARFISGQVLVIDGGRHMPA